MGCGISSTSLANDEMLTDSTMESCGRSSSRWAVRCCPLRSTLWSGQWSRAHGNKTFGIDLSSDFVWIDDAPLGFEIDALRSRDLLDRLIVIDTNKDDVGLLRAIDAINSLSKSR